MSRSTRLIVGSFVALVVMVGSACSASTDKSSEATTTAVSDAAATGDQPATTAKDVPVDEGKEKPDKNASGASGSFCDMAEGYEDVIKENMFGGLSLDEEPDEAEIFEAFKSGMNKTFDYLRDMAKVAPGELKGDMKLLLESADDYMDAVNSATSMDDEAVQKADELADSPELTAASDRLDAYMEDVCGVDLGSSFPDEG